MILVLKLAIFINILQTLLAECLLLYRNMKFRSLNANRNKVYKCLTENVLSFDIVLSKFKKKSGYGQVSVLKFLVFNVYIMRNHLKISIGG